MTIVGISKCSLTFLVSKLTKNPVSGVRYLFLTPTEAQQITHKVKDSALQVSGSQ